nr:MAG TPA: hypothetical protein [Caudoviricetes sp.]
MYYDIILLSSRSIIGTATGSSYIPIIIKYLYKNWFCSFYSYKIQVVYHLVSLHIKTITDFV